MPRCWPYAAFVAPIIGVAAFLIYPFEFIKAGWFESLFFTSNNWAVSLIQWHWAHTSRYDCSNISLLGYTSSYSVIVPAITEGLPDNIVSQVDRQKVAFVRSSDYLLDTYKQFSNDAAGLNNLLLKDCGIGNFQ